MAAGWLGLPIRVLRLPAVDRRRRFEATFELARAALALRPRSAGSALDRLTASRPGQPAVPGHAQLREAERVGRSVARVARRLPWNTSCLRQALAARRMLDRRGIPCQVHLGVRAGDERSAHAWITVRGEAVVGGAGVERFVALAAFG